MRPNESHARTGRRSSFEPSTSASTEARPCPARCHFPPPKTQRPDPHSVARCVNGPAGKELGADRADADLSLRRGRTSRPSMNVSTPKTNPHSSLPFPLPTLFSAHPCSRGTFLPRAGRGRDAQSRNRANQLGEEDGNSSQSNHQQLLMALRQRYLQTTLRIRRRRAESGACMTDRIRAVACIRADSPRAMSLWRSARGPQFRPGYFRYRAGMTR